MSISEAPFRTPVAFVSDEHYLALTDVVLEFQQCDGCVAVVRSSPRGAVYADLADGEYLVTLSKPGYGSKRTIAQLQHGRPWQFRLLLDTLYGYAWPKWVKSGGASEFRVHSPEPYHLSLWRYGIEKQLIRNIGWFDEHGPRPNLQVLPDGDFTQAGVDWNRQGYRPGAQQVIAPERSGLHYFHARTASGASFGFPWVVAPATPGARIAVLASTNTWNAYNNFGGRSNYINATGLPPTPTVNARLDLDRYSNDSTGVWNSRNETYVPLSFDRPEPFNHIPFDTGASHPIRGRQACHLAEAEWRLLAWLERERFEYDLYADHQLHAGELDLDAYRVLVLSTHPEYWSRDAYNRVKRWTQERGGKLMYLGGNGIDCEVEFLDGSAMRCKTWLPGPPGTLRFVEPDSGRPFDCRFHYTTGQSPAELLGVIFTDAGAMTSAPYRVLEVSHWAFAGTGLREGDTFGTSTLHERCPDGASGHETDKRTPSTPSDTVILARGLNECGGGAEMVMRSTASGGAVFSVGSITWPACLLVDSHVSHITRNVLARFLSG
ncbi:MAG TPA: N,N-dimethylformamidase beta subunit family domain-containing protein [Tepidisphaeraceae bacterium]|nr:N,N-dimethylformamidase beta subunit family domain-containing protein [Tepidisphaeraceae bacterium]